MDKNYIIHYGIEGQKWGRRRYQNEDGSLTDEGYIHYYGHSRSDVISGKERVKKIHNAVGKRTLKEKVQFELAPKSSVGYRHAVVTRNVLNTNKNRDIMKYMSEDSELKAGVEGYKKDLQKELSIAKKNNEKLLKKHGFDNEEKFWDTYTDLYEGVLDMSQSKKNDINNVLKSYTDKYAIYRKYGEYITKDVLGEYGNKYPYPWSGYKYTDLGEQIVSAMLEDAVDPNRKAVEYKTSHRKGRKFIM